MEIEQLYNLYLQHPSVQTDSRKLKHGDIFFALKGPNFNGNHFAKQALEIGASYVVVDELLVFEDERIIQVHDTLECLQKLAKYHRDQFDKLEGGGIAFIAITGSNGKTTTKELMHEVLSSSFKTYTTEGNLNNHIGIPLTILKIKRNAQVAVIEMGANHLKEIEGYCGYVNPTHGIITNFGKAHLEGFGGLEGVKKGKGELFDHIRSHKGTVFVNSDDQQLVEMSKGIQNVVTYGTHNGEVQGDLVHENSFLIVKCKGDNDTIIKTNLVGDYNLYNVLSAIAVGRYFKISDAKIRHAIENYVPSNSRSQLIKRNSNTIILDAYNANPSSMRAAIENFARMDASEKILLLGGMMELGKESENEHKEIITLIDKYNWRKVVLVGGSFKEISHAYINFDNALQASDWLKRQHFENVTMLIKGSRSMQMEKVLED